MTETEEYFLIEEVKRLRKEVNELSEQIKNIPKVYIPYYYYPYYLNYPNVIYSNTSDTIFYDGTKENKMGGCDV
jgi:predicted metallo-beta-lactamase superfamily hydrolase